MVLAIACTKDKTGEEENNGGNGGGNGGGGQVTEVLVTSIAVEGETFDMAENAGQKKISVTLSPSEAKVSKHLDVTCEQDGNLDYTLADDAILVTPKKKGQAKFTLKPLKGPAEAKSFTVNVLDREPELKAITIKKDGDVSGDALVVTETGQRKLEATVTNEFGNTAIVDLEWKVATGSDIISIDPSSGIVSGLKPGDATVSVKVVSNPELVATGNVKVSAISSVSIAAVTGLEGNTLKLATGSSISLTAIVKNDLGKVFSTPVEWSSSNSSKVSVNGSGTVTANGSDGSAEITCSVKAKTSVYKKITVSIVPKPATISIYGKADSDNNLVEELKPNGSMSLDVRVLPLDANQEIEVEITQESGYNSSCVLTYTTTQVSRTEGNFTRVTLKFNGTPDVKYRQVKIKAKANTSVSRACKFYCFDYFGKEIKVGDYVYRSSDRTKYRAEDCGRRTKDGQFIGGKAKTPPTVSGYEYIGVIASLDLPSDSDFLKASMLSDVYDPTLKRKSGFRKSNLVGFENFSGSHALVIAKKHSNPMKWQVTPSCIAQDNSVNTYKLNSLYGVLAFSDVELNSSIGTTYVKYGFLSSLIIKRYSGLQQVENNKVLPMNYINELNDGYESTESASGKSTTGWFIPGKGEFELITDYSWAESLKNSLSDSWDIKSTDQIYWLIEETAVNGVYDAFISTDIYGNILARFGNVSKNPSSSQPRVRPMLYL